MPVHFDHNLTELQQDGSYTWNWHGKNYTCLRDLVIDYIYFADCEYGQPIISDYIDCKDIKISDHEYSSESFKAIIDGVTV